SIITSTTRTAPWDTVHHGNFCAVGYHNPKREKVSGPMGSNPLRWMTQSTKAHFELVQSDVIFLNSLKNKT
ncbi:hypothetical protein, partial [Aeromonas caviae]